MAKHMENEVRTSDLHQYVELRVYLLFAWNGNQKWELQSYRGKPQTRNQKTQGH